MRSYNQDAEKRIVRVWEFSVIDVGNLSLQILVGQVQIMIFGQLRDFLLTARLVLWD
jgi:hypothetical protein